MKQSERDAAHWLERILQVGVFVLLGIPLLNTPQLYYSYSSAKAFALMGMIQLLVIGYAWLVYVRPSKAPRLGPVGIALTVFVALVLVTGALGVDPSLSFWGSLDRHSGGFMWLHLLALFVVVCGLFRTELDWLKLFCVSTGVAAVVAVIQLLHLFGTDVAYAAAKGSTIGNSSFLGAYLLFHVFFALLIAMRGQASVFRWYGFGAAIVLFVTLSLSTAYAALISTIGGVLLLGGLLLIASPSTSRRRVGIAGLIVLTVITVSVIVTAFQPGSFSHEAFTELSTSSRLIIWDYAWQGILERPWFGWGAETFQIVSLNHYDPCFGSALCGYEMWVDRAHNKLLDVWIEMGVLGFVSYLSILGIALWGLYRGVRNKNIKAPIAAVLTAVFAAHFVQNLTILDIPVVLMMWVLTLAMVETLVTDERKSPAAYGRWFIVVPILVTVAAVMVFTRGVLPSIEGTAAVVDANIATTGEERITAYRKAITLGDIGIDDRRVYMANQTGAVIWSVDEQTLEQILPLVMVELDLATEALNDTIDHSPNPLRAWIDLGLLYHARAHFIDPAAYADAERVLLEAIEQNPLHPQAYWELASVYLDQGRVDEALALTGFIREVSPGVSNAHLFHVLALTFDEDQEALDTAIAEALDVHPNLSKKIEELFDSDRQVLLYQLYL